MTVVSSVVSQVTGSLQATGVQAVVVFETNVIRAMALVTIVGAVASQVTMVGAPTFQVTLVWAVI